VDMKISGHKTASVFRRYDITDEADLRKASQRLRDYLERAKLENGHKRGHTQPGEVQIQSEAMPANA
jgi:hypothetical protein